MLKNELRLNKFYQGLIKKERFSYKRALGIFESMFKEGVSLGVINSKNILEGLDVDIRIAKAINSLN